MEGTYEQKYSRIPKESVDKFNALSNGLQQYLLLKPIILPNKTIDPKKLKKMFQKIEKINKSLHNDTKNMITQLQDESITKDSIKEEYLERMIRNISKIEKIEQSLQLENDLFDTIYHCKSNQHGDIQSIKNEHLIDVNKWLKKNKFPILSDEPDVENSIANIPIYNTSRFNKTDENQIHTVVSFFAMEKSRQKVSIKIEGDFIKITRNPFQKPFQSFGKKPCRYGKECKFGDNCKFYHPEKCEKVETLEIPDSDEEIPDSDEEIPDSESDDSD